MNPTNVKCPILSSRNNIRFQGRIYLSLLNGAPTVVLYGSEKFTGHISSFIFFLLMDVVVLETGKRACIYADHKYFIYFSCQLKPVVDGLLKAMNGYNRQSLNAIFFRMDPLLSLLSCLTQPLTSAP